MDEILQFLPDAVRLTHTRYGLMLYPAGDTYIGPCLQTYGEYCPEEANAFRQLIGPGQVVAEVGANVGSHTLLLAALVGSEGQVYAFEPQRQIFQILCANLALNTVLNVDARRQALGRIPETLRLSPPEPAALANFGGVSLEADGRDPVQVVTLDSLDLGRLDFIKIDVEGMEEAVIRGGLETIGRLRPKLYIENDASLRGDSPTSASLIRLIRSLGYRLWWHTPALYHHDNFRGNHTNIFEENVVSINMLCIRDDEPVETNFVEILEDKAVPRI